MIKRRSFLQGLFLFPATFLGKQSELKSNRHYILNRFSIAGFNYYKGSQLTQTLRTGDQLGYVPRSDNKYIHHLLQ